MPLTCCGRSGWRTGGRYAATRRGHLDPIFNGSPNGDRPTHRPYRGLRALSLGDFGSSFCNRTGIFMIAGSYSGPTGVAMKGKRS